jgi:polyisoprenoid-binding protein YceI
MTPTRLLALLALGALAALGAPLAFVLEAAPADSSAEPAALGPETWTVDPVHSSVVFRVKHMDVSYFYGSFDHTSGSIQYADRHAEDCKVELSIAADSVHSANADRDKHLKSPDFLNAKQFPAITFRSTKVAAASGGDLDVTGDLTFLGVTKSVTVLMRKTGQGPGFPEGELIGFEGHLSIKRTDFGNDFSVGPVSDEVELTIAIEAGKS